MKHLMYFGKQLCLVGIAAFLSGTSLISRAQDSCTQPPSCIANFSLEAVGPGYGNMNSTAGFTVPDWYVSHGTPSLFGGAFFPGGADYSVWMWSYSGIGEGIFTCYNFVAGRTYEVCLWVQNTNGVNTGNLLMVAANGLMPVFPMGTGGTPPTPTSSQLIGNTFVYNSSWTQVTYTFTANANYGQLWIYPFMAGPPVNGQYELQVDMVRVSEEATIVGDSIISWCDSTVLCVQGGPANAVYTWRPAVTWYDTDGRCVIVAPCSTTTYQVIIEGDSLCPSCSVDTLYHTVEVVTPDFVAFGDSSVRCGDSIRLWVEPGYLPCVNYDWYDPIGNYIGSGPFVIIPEASPDLSGTYTLIISYGDCFIYRFVYVSVEDCPCEFTPQFIPENCHPVYFSDVSYSSIGGNAVAWFWDFGDGNTSNEQNPEHTYADSGFYKVCLTVIWRNGYQTCCGTVCQYVYVCTPEHRQEMPGMSGLPVVKEEAGIKVFPNPASDKAFVILDNIPEARIIVRSINGAIVATGEKQGEDLYTIDLHSLAKGVYLVIVHSGDATYTVKLVRE